MRTRLLAVLAAALMAVVGAVVFTAPASAAPVGATPASSAPDGSIPGGSASDGPVLTPNLCGDIFHRRLDNHTGHFFLGTGVNIRTGPSTSCTSLGQGQPSHSVTYWCWTGPSGGFTWSFLIDNTTSVAGWVRDDLLAGNGSQFHC